VPVIKVDTEFHYKIGWQNC